MGTVPRYIESGRLAPAAAYIRTGNKGAIERSLGYDGHVLGMVQLLLPFPYAHDTLSSAYARSHGRTGAELLAIY